MVTLRSTFASASALALGGCAATLAYTPVPEMAVGRAEVAGFSHIRTWGDADAHEIDATINLGQLAPPKSSGAQARSYLALSGGGGDGAYGAGVLVGWTASGERPSFDVVTGVSTGALAAPFAFLGPSYDRKLEEIYTLYKTDDLGTPQIFSAIFGGPSLIDASGLEKLLEHYVNSDLLAEVAREHLRGRRLLVATTNVEAERQVIWNLGAIAASNSADRLYLFRRILLASAAIPGVLPPVLIQVTVDGRAFQEMHADGGTVGQVFFIPQVETGLPRKKAQNPPRLYVVRNGKTGPAWQSTEPTLLKIANRSLETLIKNQARGDVERLYIQAKSDGMSFRLASIPDGFSGVSNEPFDKEYMRQLFDLGYAEASRGYPWAKTPRR
jgi:hypothetical protein